MNALPEKNCERCNEGQKQQISKMQMSRTRKITSNAEAGSIFVMLPATSLNIKSIVS